MPLLEPPNPMQAGQPNPKPRRKPSRLQLAYEILIIIAICIDLLYIIVDAVLMSHFMAYVANWLSFLPKLIEYQHNIHPTLQTTSNFFTVFLVIELVVRWVLAMVQHRHYRWFFFPFIHWYEVLGCIPQLRALRLLRVIVIGRRLHLLGYRVMPETWLDKIKFYVEMIIEELSDRVILTATDNVRQQFVNHQYNESLIQETIDKNRAYIESTLVAMLRQELVPRVNKVLSDQQAIQPIVDQIGAGVQDAIINTPEIQRYVKMIPVAGRLIEREILTIAQHVSQSAVYSISRRLVDPNVLDPLLQDVAHHVAHIDTTNPQLQQLVFNVIEDSLTAFEKQVKIQQWKHQADLLFE